MAAAGRFASFYFYYFFAFRRSLRAGPSTMR
jgi:hypothetical protein